MMMCALRKLVISIAAMALATGTAIAGDFNIGVIGQQHHRATTPMRGDLVFGLADSEKSQHKSTIHSSKDDANIPEDWPWQQLSIVVGALLGLYLGKAISDDIFKENGRR